MPIVIKCAERQTCVFRSHLLCTAPKTHFRILSAVKPSPPFHGTVSTISLTPPVSASWSSSSRKASAAPLSSPIWKNWIPTCHAGASILSNFFAAEMMGDSTSSVGTPSVMTMMLIGLQFSCPFCSQLRRYGRRMESRRQPVGVPPLGRTALKIC